MLQNPQVLLARGKLVRIRKRRCQVGNELATFFDSFWREDQPWVVLLLPSGRRIAMPASWTDLPQNAFPAMHGRAELLPSAVMEMSRYLSGFVKRHRPTAKSQRRPRKRK